MREKIKRQESIDKENAEFKKRVKTKFGGSGGAIKSPSIKVENILTKITSDSAKTSSSDGKQETRDTVESILEELLINLPTDSVVLNTEELETKPINSVLKRPSSEHDCKNKKKQRRNSSTNSVEDPIVVEAEEVSSPEPDEDEPVENSVYDFQEDEADHEEPDAELNVELEQEEDVSVEDEVENVNEDENDDIWSSINENFDDIKQMQLDISNKNNVKITDETKDTELEYLNTSFDVAAGPLELKDEFTEEAEEDDIWACNNEILESIKEDICDVKALQSKTESLSSNSHEEVDSITTKPRDESGSRKSRQVRKMSDEAPSNPDSGKENEEIIKKINKNHSPVSKRRKISNRRYFNEEFEDSNTVKGSKRSSVDSVKSESNSSRGRSLSTSTDEGSEYDSSVRKSDHDRSSKYNKSHHHHHQYSSKSKKIKLIEPSPVDPESLINTGSGAKKSKKDAVKKNDSGRERRKSDDKSVKTSATHKPSKILIDLFEKEKARNSQSKKAKY